MYDYHSQKWNVYPNPNFYTLILKWDVPYQQESTQLYSLNWVGIFYIQNYMDGKFWDMCIQILNVCIRISNFYAQWLHGACIWSDCIELYGLLKEGLKLNFHLKINSPPTECAKMCSTMALVQPTRPCYYLGQYLEVGLHLRAYVAVSARNSVWSAEG